MDQSIYDYIEHIRYDVPQSVIDVLLCLGRASLRYVGLSFMKQATIAKETGYSRKTVNKALKTLESWGVVDSVRTKTKAGRPSVKVVRILPFSIERLHQGVTTNEAENKSVDNIDNMDVDQLQDFIPDVIVERDFVEITKPYFGTRKILSLNRTLQNALNKFKLTYYDPYVPHAVASALKSSVWAYKMSRIKKNLASYFYGVLDSELAIASRRIAWKNKNYKNNHLFYNWLEVY